METPASRKRAGVVQVWRVAGRYRGCGVSGSGPLRFRTSFLLICLAAWAGLGVAQAQAQAQAPVQAPQAEVPAPGQTQPPLQPAQDDAANGADARERPAWRSIAGYPLPALADTVVRMQHVAQAMQLREYCANRRLADEFVRERLQRFSRLTGREEDCQTLLDY